MRCSQRCSGTWSCLPSPENKHQEISLTKLGRLWNSQPLGPLVQLKPEDMCCLSLAMLEITQTTSQFSRTSQITLCGVTSIHTMMLRRTHTMKTEDIFFCFWATRDSVQYHGSVLREYPSSLWGHNGC